MSALQTASMMDNSLSLSPPFNNFKYNSIFKNAKKHFFKNKETIKLFKEFSLESNMDKKYEKIFEGVLMLPFCERESSNRRFCKN